MGRGIALLFAGQGAQTPGMGKDLYDGSEAARACFDQADRILGRSVTGLCFDATAEELTASANCQPAIFTLSLACLAALQERVYFCPAVVGGLSLGEIAALVASGALAFDEGLRLVAKRGILMDEACRATDGAMAAVIKADEAVLEVVCREKDVDIANLNCPGQTVISGERAKVEAAVENLKAKELRVVMLQVAGAFHSRLMSSAADAFRADVEACALTTPTIPLVQNVPGGEVSRPVEIARNLVEQVRGTVRWESCMRWMLENQCIEIAIELGPGNVLCGLLKRTDRAVESYSTSNIGNLEKAAAALGS